MKKRNNFKEDGLTYWDHLEELRKRLIFCLFIFLFFSIVSFFFVDKIIISLKKPLTPYGITLNYFKPYEKFSIYIKLSLFSGIILSLPFFLIQLFSFILPALKKEEKKITLSFSLLSILTFFIGIIFSYFVIFPVALNFLINFSKNDSINMLWGFSSYFDLLISISLSTIIVFQLPIVLLILLKLNIISISSLSKARKYIIILIAFLSALFSPPDVLSMFLIGIPLYLLFEVTFILARIFIKSNPRKE